MNRLERLTAILIQLQSKRIVKAQEIAERFEISLRTVYRDIRTLELAGVPILSEAGIGYSIMKEYRLPPIQFTADEALAFFTAEKVLAKISDPKTLSNYASGLFKIKAVLNHQEKELLDEAKDYISFKESQYLPDNSTLNVPEILQSILHKKVIRIKYFNSSSFEENERSIEPVGIYSQNAYWYLIAWCRLRNDYRVFRFDKINEIEISKDKFTTKHPSLESFLKTTAEEKALTKVVIRIEKSGYKYLGNQHFYMGFIDQKDLGEQVEMSFLSASLSGFAHWFMLLGHDADIIEPESLKQLVLEKLEVVKCRINGKTHI